MNAKTAETFVSQRNKEDVPALRALLGRFIQRYFDGYGNYTGKITSIDADNATAAVVYEDGATEEIFLDQIQRALLPASYRPAHATEVLPGVEQYGCTWPPPSVSHKLILNEPRRRKPSNLALERMLMEEARKFEREARKQERAANAAKKTKSAAAATSTKKASRVTKKKKPAKTQPASSSPATKATTKAKKTKVSSAAAARRNCKVATSPTARVAPRATRAPTPSSSATQNTTSRSTLRAASSESSTPTKRGSVGKATRTRTTARTTPAKKASADLSSPSAPRTRTSLRSSRRTAAAAAAAAAAAVAKENTQSKRSAAAQAAPSKRAKTATSRSSRTGAEEALLQDMAAAGITQRQPSSSAPASGRATPRLTRRVKPSAKVLANQEQELEAATSKTQHTKRPKTGTAKRSASATLPTGNVFETDLRSSKTTPIKHEQTATKDLGSAEWAAEVVAGPPSPPPLNEEGEPVVLALGPSKPLSKQLLNRLRAYPEFSPSTSRGHSPPPSQKRGPKSKATSGRSTPRKAATKAGKRATTAHAAKPSSPTSPSSSASPSSRRAQGKQASKPGTPSPKTSSPLVVAASSQGSEQRAWKMCPKCNRKHWNTDPCSLMDAQAQGAGSDPSSTQENVATMRRKWSGTATQSLLEILESQQQADMLAAGSSSHARTKVKLSPRPPLPTSTQPLPTETQKTRVDRVYRIIGRKHDVTSGADGRYGITGHATKGSMAKLLTLLQNKCELNENATFLDLGHGMGRPNFHAAALTPPVKASVGTEYNPHLYKQSMLVLRELAQEDPSYLANPRVFFMDRNIRDLSSIVPFTHLFCFNIGMPDDIVRHIMKLISASTTLKYAVLFPHNYVTSARISALGERVCSLPMSMPGGCSYEAIVIKTRQAKAGDGFTKGDHASSAAASSVDTLPSPAVLGEVEPRLRTHISDRDEDVDCIFQLLADPQLYSIYVRDLGAVGALEFEERQLRSTRASRRSSHNTRFLAMSPCLPDIPLGLLRRVCIALGLSSSGEKVDLLANVQAYVPATFGISMFATGQRYSSDDVDRIVSKLLAKEPSRRQPELA
ncbi:hypothetical protein PTSG_04628 [Salpingoeca rosetta]|uniref:Uncharacterized protein n=1 Tax=Salpingoeca rosetta (strain ATCC 50818 / BSB-021) TaxID=946362 RepID=F2U7Z4_SALR5|nr:uncharacterized protein PTSG_04628 [Salpingoeca rosetta]EGD72899.1 hypothetical protein PTSG_04628 [Salpingoeca rosetta]|eukprot:XP_004994721.1 hypothetical protein PTSG_04628 [Salpingoeca rosetta]